MAMEHEQSCAHCGGVFRGTFCPCTLSQPSQNNEAACIVCCNRAAMTNTCHCSKRCEWYSKQRCPQCGRSRDARKTFCSQNCAGQSRRANWCPACGVRQITSGADKCAFLPCQLAEVKVRDRCGAPAAAFPPVGAPRDVVTHHSWLPIDDPTRRALEASFARVGRVLGVVRFNPDVSGKKRYLGYRAFVEHFMSSNRRPKFGHGGEGNEQRRYIPVPLTCQRVVNMLLTAPDGPNRGMNATTCLDPTCKVCGVLSFGLSMERLQIPCHFSTNSPESCIKYCAPMQVSENQDHPDHERFVALILAARVVVGVPHVLGTLAHTNSDGLSDSGNAGRRDSRDSLDSVHSGFYQHVTHSTIEVKPDGTDELMVSRDDAVDPLHFIFCEYFAPRTL